MSSKENMLQLAKPFAAALSEAKLNPVREQRLIIALYFATDLLVLWLCLSLATFIRLDVLYFSDFLLLERDRWVCIILFALIAGLTGCYRSDRILDRFDAIYFTLIALAGAAIAASALMALLPHYRALSRSELVLGFGFAAIVLSVWHGAAARVVARFSAMHRFFYVLGDESRARSIVREIRYEAAGRMDARYLTPEQMERRLTRRDDSGKPSAVTEDAIVVVEEGERALLLSLLELCETWCRHTYLYPSVDDTLLFQHQRLASVAGLPLIEVPSRAPNTPYLYAKRVMDIAVSLLGLILSAPLLLVLAAAVKATSRGPVLYRQERLGRDGKPFHINKFRSMRVNADAAAADVRHQRAQRQDPRITPVGRILRKYKLDELPQLINVLKGDMSLIGPRPLWREFFEENGLESPLCERRLAVRPGLTSLLHVQGHSFAKAEDFLRYDLVYINNISLLNDMRILVGTIRIVLSGKGSTHA